MIIKSKSRKTASFRQLIEYFHKEKTADTDAFTHNLLGDTAENAIAQMEENAKFLPKRQNGNVVYHEIISLPENPKVPIPRQAAMLEDCVRFYVERRCPKSLVYGKLHRDQKHLHFHLAISANGLKDRYRHWLSKSDLARIQSEVEEYRIAKYPELGLERYYDEKARLSKRKREENSPHLTDRENALKRRTGQPSRKENDYARLHKIFAKAVNEIDLNDALLSAGFGLYVRGRSEGVIAKDGRKYRLKTLGLENTLQTAKKRMAIFTKRQEEFQRPRSHDRNRERS